MINLLAANYLEMGVPNFFLLVECWGEGGGEGEPAKSSEVGNLYKSSIPEKLKQI